MTKLEQIRDAISLFDLDGAGPDYDANLLKAARAAVEALRKPTPAMVGIGQVHDMYGTSAEINLDVWTAMVDAILNEKPDDT